MTHQFEIPFDLPPLTLENFINTARNRMFDIAYHKHAGSEFVQHVYEISGLFRISWGVSAYHSTPMFALNINEHVPQRRNVHMPMAHLRQLFGEMANLYARAQTTASKVR